MAILVMSLMASERALAYSVLTHEEIVDLLWIDGIRPLLLSRFPGLSDDELREAHGYAYGGAVIQDLGYYPFGSGEFSDLVHYVRSGDFVRELLSQSQDADEFAFALGALGHYASDIAGHPAVNQAVAIEYPKLRKKFGNSVTYEQDKTAHLKTEFGFDAIQIAKNRYASPQYHDFIGFKVSKPLLERVFPVVYGVELTDVLSHADLAIGSYRFAISRLIPQLTQVALQIHPEDMMREKDDAARRLFLYRLSRTDYEKEWGKDYARPGFGTRVLSTLLRFIPKVGPFKGLAFTAPTAQTEDLYVKSINTTVDQYRAFLHEVGTNSLVLPNRNLDSGNATKAAEYFLTDDAYAKLLGRLAARKFNSTTTDLRLDILRFYSSLSAPIETKKHPDQWKGVLIALDQLKVATPVPVLATADQAITAQDGHPPPTPPHTGVPALLEGFLGDVKHLPAMENLYIGLIGGGAAVGLHPFDRSVNAKLRSHNDVADDVFAAGKYLGNTPEQVALSLGTYVFGRVTGEKKVSHLGMDLLRAQMLTAVMVEPLKFSVGRKRPDGSNRQSFPSGHAAVTFAAATALERHLGWKRAALAYGIATYMSATRLHDNVHYLSDVAFGAAIGGIAGRTVTQHGRNSWTFVPVHVPGGFAMLVTRTGANP
jgi:Zinc dependent phospholipase C/PAP2 superfamily